MTTRRTISSRTSRRTWLAASLLVTSTALSGCYGAAEEDWDGIAVGEDGVVGTVELRSILIVGSEEGAPGRLLGTLENEADEPVEVTISDTDDEVTVTVPANDQYPLDTNEVIFDTVDETPGGLTTILFTTEDDAADLESPVRDGTLEQYAPYLPE